MAFVNHIGSQVILINLVRELRAEDSLAYYNI